MNRRIEIVGGGLAGLSLGLALRRSGIPVALFEARRYPRHRVCGEFIAGLSQETIACLGLEAPLSGSLLHREVAWVAGGSPPRVMRLPEPAFGISRHALDCRLAEAFERAGGSLFAETRVAEADAPPGRIFSTGRRRRASPWLGLKAHYRGLRLDRDLEVHLGRHAYVGMSPVEDGAVNVCGLFAKRPVSSPASQILPAYLRASGLAALAERLSRAERVDGSSCAIAAWRGDPLPPRHDRMRLGDAFAATPPFTGNGMAMAFQSAEIALGPVAAFARGEIRWHEAVRIVDASLRRHFRIRLASAHALHPCLLRPGRQRWLGALRGLHLLPLGPLYSLLH